MRTAQGEGVAASCYGERAKRSPLESAPGDNAGGALMHGVQVA